VPILSASAVSPCLGGAAMSRLREEHRALPRRAKAAGEMSDLLRRVEGVRDHIPPGLPPDPFADDPLDPSAALDAIEPGQPLDPQERTAVEADLADLAVYEALLANKGIRGLVVSCDECQQDHYHDWDMLRANLLQLLVDGTVRPHEPAYDPEPDAYVTWDYCRGYADASLNEAASESDGYR
jgi:Family of unknown function (DUF5319)